MRSCGQCAFSTWTGFVFGQLKAPEDLSSRTCSPLYGQQLTLVHATLEGKLIETKRLSEEFQVFFPRLRSEVPHLKKISVRWQMRS